MSFYKEKAEHFHIKWSAAMEMGDDKEADKFMIEYLGYKKFIDNPELTARHR